MDDDAKDPEDIEEFNIQVLKNHMAAGFFSHYSSRFQWQARVLLPG
ncbi:MAG: hypothetical protein ACE5JS_15355 [Nitrospinota bacterium]